MPGYWGEHRKVLGSSVKPENAATTGAQDGGKVTVHLAQELVGRPVKRLLNAASNAASATSAMNVNAFHTTGSEHPRVLETCDADVHRAQHPETARANLHSSESASVESGAGASEDRPDEANTNSPRPS